MGGEVLLPAAPRLEAFNPKESNKYSTPPRHSVNWFLFDGRTNFQQVLEITAPDLVRIAWHVGNRHTPCQVETGRLLIQPDHVIREMLGKLGAVVREIEEPFTPEGGAYGHGRTHGHSH
ncbi:MAG: hypothetical protein CO095_12775 [Armatimonadetes bacterium CG_4_9_14_3_um_filter_58_7]|nr:MAG: hypothetical protein CO095_12775 [Armatimonadetes bacterium CG_4_9_14_3_um_filter_58_7]